MSVDIWLIVVAILFNVAMAIFNYKQASLDTQNRVQEIFSVLPILSPVIMAVALLISLPMYFIK